MIAAWLSAVWSMGVTSVSLRAGFARRRPVAPPDVVLRRTLLVRPCAGAEPELARTLRSRPRMHASRELALRFAVATKADGAWAAASEAAAAFVAEGLEASVVVTGAVRPNRKADQLARVLELEKNKPAMLVVADSDVDLTAVDLEALLAPLEMRRVAAAWAAPVEVCSRTLADRASAAVLDSSLHAFPLLAALDPGEIVGKLLALRWEDLDAVGGFAGLTEVLGEDLELARRLRLAGFQIAFAPVLAPSCVSGRSWRSVLDRYVRWVLVIRGQRPSLLLSYPVLFFATLPIVVLASASLVSGGSLAWAPALLACVSRFSVACLARRLTGRPFALLTMPRDIVLADALLAAAFCVALSTRRTVWRGVTLRVEPGGALRATDDGAPRNPV